MTEPDRISETYYRSTSSSNKRTLSTIKEAQCQITRKSSLETSLPTTQNTKGSLANIIHKNIRENSSNNKREELHKGSKITSSIILETSYKILNRRWQSLWEISLQ